MDGHPGFAESLQEMAAKLLRGDEKVLAEILRNLGPAVQTLLTRKYRGLQTPEDIEDVLAIALFRLWRGRHLYDPERVSLQAWFYRIADNVVKDVLRSGWHKARQLETLLPQFPEKDSQVSSSGTSPPPEDNSGHPQQIQDLREVVAALPEVQRQIIWADAQAKDAIAGTAALAQELGLPAGTIRVYRKRALDAIRTEMRKRGYQVP
jgi:RNA polymerase sigma factor (sigma-70 family)